MMNIHKKDFYLLTYTKGTQGKLNRQFALEINHLKSIRKTIVINEEKKDIDPLLIKRHFLSQDEALLVGRSIQIRPRTEQYHYCIQLSANQDYFFQEFEKPTPWRLLEVYPLNIGKSILRDIFKNDPYHQNPNDAHFKPNINRSEQYSERLEPYLDFTFKLNKYDYWINQRWQQPEVKTPLENNSNTSAKSRI